LRLLEKSPPGRHRARPGAVAGCVRGKPPWILYFHTVYDQPPPFKRRSWA
jgi:hypothetical protein